MSTVAFIRRCREAGMDWETALKAAEAFEAEPRPLLPELTTRQARNRRHYERRLKASETSEIKTLKTLSDASKTIKTLSDGFKTLSDADPRARVEDTSLPSLRSEELNPLTNPSGSSPAKPKRPAKAKSRVCPADWLPSDADLAVGAGEGFTAGEIERELAKFRDYEFRDPHSDWSRCFRTWLRRTADRKPRLIHDRSSPDAKLAAKQANYDRAWEGSERAAGPRWKP